MRKLIDHKKKFDLRYKKVIEENIYNLSGKNLELLKDFLNLCNSEGMTSARQYKYLILIPKIVEYAKKDFIDFTKEDLINIAGFIRNQEYSEQTKLDYIGMIKKLYKTITILDKYSTKLDKIYYWLYDKRNKFFSTNLDRKKIKTKKEWFNTEDVKKIIDGASNFRDKAFFSIMATQGTRPQEILGIRKKDIEIIEKENLIQIEITGKTGSRYLFITEEFVRNFLMSHIETIKDDKEYIFSISDRRMNDVLKEICYNEGIKKKAHLYKLRHFAVTQDRIKGRNDAVLEQKYGWVKGSNRVRTYDHSTSMDYKSAATNNENIEKPPQIEDVVDYNKLKNKKLEKEFEELKVQVKELVEIFDWLRKEKGKEIISSLSSGV